MAVVAVACTDKVVLVDTATWTEVASVPLPALRINFVTPLYDPTSGKFYVTITGAGDTVAELLECATDGTGIAVHTSPATVITGAAALLNAARQIIIGTVDSSLLLRFDLGANDWLVAVDLGVNRIANTQMAADEVGGVVWMFVGGAAAGNTRVKVYDAGSGTISQTFDVPCNNATGVFVSQNTRRAYVLGNDPGDGSPKFYVYDADTFASVTSFAADPASSVGFLFADEGSHRLYAFPQDGTIWPVDYSTNTPLAQSTFDTGAGSLATMGVSDDTGLFIVLGGDPGGGTGLADLSHAVPPADTWTYEGSFSGGSYLPNQAGQIGALAVSSSATPPSAFVARPANWRTVRFELPVPPDFAENPSTVGDALNPGSWTISRPDTGAVLTPILVTAVDATTFDVTTIETLPSHLITLDVGCVGLLFFGAPVTITQQVRGLIWQQAYTPEAVAAQKRQVSTDLSNPATPQPGSSGLGGTLVVQGGDYANVTGAALVRKLIYRRLTTPVGGFFHLPNYGSGVSAKGLIQPNNLTKRKAEVERQCRLEPEVADAQAQVSLLPNGILFTQVNARVRPTGDKIQVSSSSVDVLPGQPPGVGG